MTEGEWTVARIGFEMKAVPHPYKPRQARCGRRGSGGGETT